MGSYHGPKAKVQRRFGEVLVPRPKYQRVVEKRPYPPGHLGRDKQFRSRRRSDYGLQLDEKQKLAFIYNVREGQMRRYYLKAAKQPGPTGANMLVALECRLDNLVYRAGFAGTIWAARQMVSHKHILVNGRAVNIPSYSVRPGEIVTLRQRMHNNPQVEQWMTEAGTAPPYLTVDKNAFSATLERPPSREEIPVLINEQLVVEFYNRRT
ncbi:MAG: 30S ribosomal protein S4 [Anaerolineae bacterium]|nr:30S ribosomal protein S4 [Anaerolineae bacterium]